MTISNTTVISSNEDGNIEVQIEHDRTVIDKIFGFPSKIEKYIHPNEKWHGVSIWRDKDTRKFISPNKTIEIIDIMMRHERIAKKG